MTYAVFDFASIGASIRKASSLKTEPNTVHAKVYVPPQFDDYGMYAGYHQHAEFWHGISGATTTVDAGAAFSVFWSAADGCYKPVE